jgi:hypothetical protein
MSIFEDMTSHVMDGANAFMKLQSEPSFIWPEPRILETLCAYECDPPTDRLALISSAEFGTVSALTGAALPARAGFRWSSVNYDFSDLITRAGQPG